MITLGINAAFHDSSASLVIDGKVVAAAEEERFNRVKHGKRPMPFSAYELPFNAIHYCLKEAGIGLRNVDHIAYSFDPSILLRDRKLSEDGYIRLPLEPSAHAARPKHDWESVWDPLFLSSIVNAKRHLLGGVPLHLKKPFEGVSLDGPTRWHFVPHHLAHAASAYYASPFDRAAVLTLDGRGERATTSYAIGEQERLELIQQVEMPHSIGLLYEEVTKYLGFLHSSDEYKVMALASYGQPKYADRFREILEIRGDGTYTMRDPDLVRRLGPARPKGGELEARHYDIARSLQCVLEESALDLARWFQKKSGCKNLCLAGGVALNCVMNARLRDEGPFEQVWVQPAAGDSGTSLGAALWTDARQSARQGRVYEMEHAYLGPGYSDGEIEDLLMSAKLPYRRMRDVASETAEILASDRIIGWFQGRMEFGPRALGSRSILASPIDPSMQEKLNHIKDREDFRPVAPVVLEEEAPSWFAGARRSPFMLFVNPVLPEKADRIPAVRHVDGTARIQTVTREQNPLYYDLLRAFRDKTGVPVLVNTSFNSRGEPIVCSPKDAVECFWSTPLDALVIGSFVLEKPREKSA